MSLPSRQPGDHASATPEPRVAEPRLADDTLNGLVQLFKLLADETRLKILSKLLTQHEQHVRALCDWLQQSQPAVSHHLALLRDAGIIQSRRQGKHNFYRIVPQRIEQILDLVFAQTPADQRSFRLASYQLSYQPTGKN